MGYAFAVMESDREYGAELDPDARAERIDELSERLGTLVGHIHAGMHHYLEIVAELDRLEAWEWAGHRTPAHWLSHETGFDLGTCREHVRVARALEELPVTSEAMSRGELSFSKVRALTRAATPETEEDL
ncbi:MAG: DUF222 domain-containing protein, partial [Gemmatimonadota bacterium]|nr:DUF222 domain-containing protein [Gemmatimonadota bacterium]